MHFLSVVVSHLLLLSQSVSHARKPNGPVDRLVNCDIRRQNRCHFKVFENGFMLVMARKRRNPHAVQVSWGPGGFQPVWGWLKFEVCTIWNFFFKYHIINCTRFHKTRYLVQKTYNQLHKTVLQNAVSKNLQQTISTFTKNRLQVGLFMHFCDSNHETTEMP